MSEYASQINVTALYAEHTAQTMDLPQVPCLVRVSEGTSGSSVLPFPIFQFQQGKRFKISSGDLIGKLARGNDQLLLLGRPQTSVRRLLLT